MLNNYQIKGIKLETLDNPGWSFDVFLAVVTDDRRIEHHRIDESDWFFISIHNNNLRVDGDETKLVKCVLAILDYFSIPISSEIEGLIPYIEFLQDWYAEQCDEDWEHTYGVNASIDEEGYCRFAIDLYGTWGYLDEQEFGSVGNRETFYCRKEEQQLVGEGNIKHLIIFLKAFKEWIEEIVI